MCPTDSEAPVAMITIDPQAKKVIKLEFSCCSLRFKCQRCAVFCCKLGGPRLSVQDVERIMRAGHKRRSFLKAGRILKDRSDGSCVFLMHDAERGRYGCAVYDYRPTLCRLYPFCFERAGPRSYALKLIPCCNGLSYSRGSIVNEKFFFESLQNAMFDLLDSDLL